ncbi:MAG: T9SS type A sorting domain-containing protein [Bacteroidia bacterium]|nr:T9SS type A sorting domain-containing protein [Bacteroidia bacterium]
MTTIYLYDDSPASLACKQPIPNQPVHPFNSPYIPEIAVRKINTQSFNNEYLNNAVKQTIDLIAEEPAQSATFEELSKFHEILTYPVTDANIGEEWLLDFSYTYDKSSYGGWQKNKLNIELSDENVQKIIEIENLFINKYITEENNKKHVHLKVNKAQTYRIINHRDLAINELNEALVIADTFDLPLLNQWLCINQTEDNILKGFVGAEEIQTAIEQCDAVLQNKSAYITSVSNNNAQENKGFEANDELMPYLNIYPNPAGEYFVVEYNLQGLENSGYKFVLTDILGKVVYSNEVYGNFSSVKVSTKQIPYGIYFWKLNTAGETIDKGKIVITK